MSEFIKDHGKNADLDWQRVLWLYEVAQKCRLFKCPKPLGRNGSKISYERIENFISGIELCFSDDPGEKFHRIGMALAAIHDLDGGKGCSRVKLHGDFGLVNLGWSLEENLPIIFDPLPSAFFPYVEPTGDRYYDLGHLVSTFFTPENSLAFFRKDPTLPKRCLQSFIRGYEGSAQFMPDRDRLARFAQAIYRRYLVMRMHCENRALRILYVPLIWLQQQRMLKEIECLTTA